MKIALVTTNFGGVDDVVPPVEQTMAFDCHCFTEHNTPFPLSGLATNRLKAKYIKIMTPEVLPDYDIYIYIDGRVRVTSSRFVEFVYERLVKKKRSHFAVLHPERTNVYDELQSILTDIDNGDEYALSRYTRSDIEAELNFYGEEKAMRLPLYAAGIFATLTDFWNDHFREIWWQGVMKFGNFDQGYYSYALDHVDMKVATLPYLNDYFTVGKHADPFK